jgi:hypothetical protein
VFSVPSVVASISALAIFTSAFMGREADLEKLGDLLQKRSEVAVTQTVALHGLGGMGKTQLAIEAWKHLGGYEAVLWVKADNPQTLDASLAGIAGVLGLPEASAKEQDVQTDAVLGWLKGRERWLLIADNAEPMKRRWRCANAWGLTWVAML